MKDEFSKRPDKSKITYPEHIPISDLVFQDIKWEHSRQLQKWGLQKMTLNEWLNFSVEEIGELAKAISDYNYREGNAEEIYKEAIQVCALCSKIAHIIKIHGFNKKTKDTPKVGEPLYATVQCQDCWHKWNGFFPDGIEFDTPVECPKCNKMRGMLLPIKEDTLSAE